MVEGEHRVCDLSLWQVVLCKHALLEVSDVSGLRLDGRVADGRCHVSLTHASARLDVVGDRESYRASKGVRWREESMISRETAHGESGMMN